MRTEVLKAQIGPSILNANLASLRDECIDLMNCGADFLHLDVMDGHFVPNLTFGHPLVKCLRDSLGSDPFFDMHMMVANPESWVKPMAKAGANQYTFHLEATEDVEDCVRLVKEAGMRVGIGIKPGTPVGSVLEIAKSVDMVLIMTVEPGFGGQKFMSDMMDKVRTVRSTFPHLNIEVDGGVGPSTIDACAAAGANMIVSGTAVINSPDRKRVITELREAVRKYLGS